MVRERSARPKRAAPTRRSNSGPGSAKVGSIWETPHIKALLAQPVGSPVELLPREMRAILDDMINNPPPYDPDAAERDHRELRNIRRMWGSIARDV